MLTLALLACSPRTSTADVVLVLLPGLRAGTGVLAEPEQAMLAAFDGEPLRFTQAYSASPSPWTAFGSTWTGQYPSGLPLCGAANQPEYVLGAGQKAWCSELPAGTRTLPEVLGLYGYTTHVVAAATHADGLLGEDVERVSGWTRTRQAAERWWLEAEGAPRLLVVIADDFTLPALSATFPHSGPGPRNALDAASQQDPARLRATMVERATRAGEGLSDLLGALSPGDDDLVVVTSTHGTSLAETQPHPPDRTEAFLMLGLPTTQIALERTLHVPLWLLGPEAGTADHVVELVDLMPTVARHAGAVAPGGLPGQDLLATPAEGQAYAEFGDMLALRSGDHLLTFRCYVHNGTSLDPGIDARLRDLRLPHEFATLHQVIDDPLQQHDLLAAPVDSQDLALGRALVRDLRTVRAGPGAVPPGAMTPERLEAVRRAGALGCW